MPLGAGLRVSAYERVVSMVLALLVIVGSLVAVLLIAWLGMTIFIPYRAVPITLEEIGGGVSDGVPGEGQQLDSPYPQDVPFEGMDPEPAFEETLAAVTDALATQLAEIVDPTQTDDPQFRGGARTQGTGTRPGRGSGEGASGYPRAQRWEVRFGDGATTDEYARQLDFFGIELGAVGSGRQVLYLSELAQGTPQQRTGQREEETRLYMTWRSPERLAIDIELFRRAGIDVAGRVLLQFYPPAVEAQLARLEQAFAGRQPEEIRRTVFGIRRGGAGYEFYVIEQI